MCRIEGRPGLPHRRAVCFAVNGEHHLAGTDALPFMNVHGCNEARHLRAHVNVLNAFDCGRISGLEIGALRSDSAHRKLVILEVFKAPPTLLSARNECYGNSRNK